MSFITAFQLIPLNESKNYTEILQQLSDKPLLKLFKNELTPWHS